ncbi:MAG: DUF3592 domain-containing protein [Janthinobacterium lividum]
MSGVVAGTGSSIGIRIAFALGGAGLLVAAYLLASSIMSFRTGATRAEGTVTALSAGGSHPVIRFTTADGSAFSFSSNGLIFGYRAGDRVAVLYDKAAPQRSAALDAVGSLYFFPLMLGLIGASFIVVPLLSTYSTTRSGS